MTYRVVISERAVRDIIRNANWWSDHRSPEDANVWQAAIFAKIQTLVEFPLSHPLADENAEFPFELRESLFGIGAQPGYRILFTVEDEEIYILAVKATEENWVSPDEFNPN